MQLLNPLQQPGTLPELEYLNALLASAGPDVRVDVPLEVTVGQHRLPVHCIEIGSDRADAPAIGFFGGVHGVERIGAQVVLAWLHSILQRLHWDDGLHAILRDLRLVFMPLVSPGGMLARTRSNPAGVDLMRNAPVDADAHVALLLGGQRLSRHLPWYRGRPDCMEAEAKALCATVRTRLLRQPFALTVDCHSGFGTRDHLWFPYARTREPIGNVADFWALRSLFRATHPYHSIYVIEPQSRRYTTHGDVWDHLYDTHVARANAAPFLPLTLELGSWLWVKKSPSQLLSQIGMFNPLSPHRHRRILRQHTTLLDFLMRATHSHQRWLPTKAHRDTAHAQALDYWYRDRHQHA